jgi:hypothetical protein
MPAIGLAIAGSMGSAVFGKAIEQLIPKDAEPTQQPSAADID